MRNGKKLLILEAPVSVGSPTRGTEDAYSALVSDGLPGVMGDAAVFSPYDGKRSAKETLHDERLRHLETVMTVCRENYRRTSKALSDGYIPLTLGGDHSLAMSSVAAVSEKYGADGVAVIYIDAHADINTEATSPSGMIHGMPLAAAMGLCTERLTVGKRRVNLYGKNTYIVGAHSIDEGEWGIIEEQGVHLYTADEVKRRGIDEVINEVIRATEGMHVHLSFDVDSIRGDEFPATGYALNDSLPLSDVVYALGAVWDDVPVVSLDVVEYNPRRDPDGACRDILFDIFSIFKR